MQRKLIYVIFLLFVYLFGKAQDFSNKGKEFWVGYGYHQSMTNSANPQDMVLYFTSDVAATVKVDIPGIGWSRTYQVAANSVTESDAMPKSGTQDARLLSEQVYNAGIHITSDNPIVAYAHIYSTSVSGASLLFPVNTLGQDYYSLNFTQKTNAPESNSWAFVIATEDNTLVEITPSAKTQTHAAGQPFTVALNKGQIFNVMGATTGNDGVDLSGTRIRSISTGSAGCKRIAVYSGSGRSSIACDYSTFPSSDNLFQQAFPQNVWGKKFLTVPTSELSNNYFRIAVSDPTTVVTIDGVRATNLINNFYYEIMANAPKSILSDKPIMVAQYITSADACNNVSDGKGDPEMIYISPVEQTIDKITLNSTSHYQITSHYINVVIKTSAVNSFTLDGASSPSAFKTHPADPAFSYAVFPVKQGSHSLKADSGFNAIAYGYGVKESYGYNAGTNIKNLHEFVSVKNPYAVSTTTCSNTPFFLAVTLPYKPTSLVWDFGNLQNLTPSQNITENNPVADSSYITDGKTLYVYRLKVALTYSATGTFPVKIFANNQSSDGCNGEQEIDYDVQVFTAPKASFSIAPAGCATDTVKFADASNGNGNAIIKWKWDFGDATTDTVANPSKTYKNAGTYNVKLTSINNIGCFADTTMPFALASPPVAKFGFTAPECVNNVISFTDLSTISQGNIAKWNWKFGNGDSITNSTNASPSTIYHTPGAYSVNLQVENAAGCKSNIASQTITVHSSPVVDFSMPGVCLPAGVAQFTNLSTINDGTENSLTYVWDFGDGVTSTEKSPAHVYKTADSVNVNLKATSVFGCSTDSVKILSNIYAQPHADFAASTTKVCEGDSVAFTDASSAPKSSVNTWFWNFGDGSTSNVQNPVKKFPSAGPYIVTLYIKSASGCMSDTIQKTITVNKAPTAGFTVAASACEKQAVTINNQSSSSSGNITNSYWTFGDGTTANNQNGASFPKTYQNPGSYTIQLAVQDANGCQSDTTGHTVTINAAPVANFISPVACVNDPAATFTDSSYIPGYSDGALTYSWNFGDQNATALNPNTATDQNPKHKFSSPGYYNISLTTTSSTGCSSTVTKPFTVNGVPEAAFTVLDSSVICSNSKVLIQNNSTVTPGVITKIEIVWDADNAPGTFDTDNNPSAAEVYSHSYSSSLSTKKTYNIKMRAFSGINCVGEKVLPITVQPSPKVTFSTIPGICLSDSAYTITQARETTGLTGMFVFSGKGVLPNGHFYPSTAGAGVSTIKYTFTSNDGCKDSAEQTIEVVQNPTIKLPAKVYSLEGGSIKLEPEIIGNISKYFWSPGTWLDNANIKTPTSTPSADITYNLTVSTPEGCTAYGSVLVSFLTAPIIPTAFSPNGDGINDVWNIPSLQSFSNCTVQIFNRYGKIVFSSTGYSKPWDGSYNGSILPVGVYYYIINAGNGKRPYSGSLTILK
ncbi:T9SS C-terminal target domain-containing protein [Segetibacter koreensis]|uniref:T9SS C-terminal target domain-containing protein n=1 Tax=Segetibacter koreensis TaxID=398037 RepID=UPI00035F4321|nr:T9SS C-terminal target domain-containing protein [Segetibacter koreensis]